MVVPNVLLTKIWWGGIRAMELLQSMSFRFSVSFVLPLRPVWYTRNKNKNGMKTRMNHNLMYNNQNLSTSVFGFHDNDFFLILNFFISIFIPKKKKNTTMNEK